MVDRIAPGWEWQIKGTTDFGEKHLQRRSAVGHHDMRLDGMADLLSRARGASVLDIGMNRGHVGYEFYLNGARLVHGCDVYEPGVQVARHWFAEVPSDHCQYKFEVVDLTQPNALIDAFGWNQYDIVLFIGVYHKLVRHMKPDALSALVRQIGKLTKHYLGFNGYTDQLAPLDADLAPGGLKLIHTSEILGPGRPAAIWKREK